MTLEKKEGIMAEQVNEESQLVDIEMLRKVALPGEYMQTSILLSNDIVKWIDAKIKEGLAKSRMNFIRQLFVDLVVKEYADLKVSNMGKIQPVKQSTLDEDRMSLPVHFKEIEFEILDRFTVILGFKNRSQFLRWLITKRYKNDK